MWLYEQRTGSLYLNGMPQGFGYAGRFTGVNNPDMQAVHNIGPLPVGIYRIGDPQDNHLGPMSFPLKQDPSNIMFGRDLFWIHADLINAATNPHMASEGCIIMSGATRQRIKSEIASGERMLEVVADYTPNEGANS